MPLSGAAPRLTPGTVLRTDDGRTVLVRAWRGEGSHARVYRGILEQSGAPCAVKVAKPEVPESGERLRRECEVLTGVQHPRVVRLVAARTEGCGPWLVLEWLDGDTLLDLVAARRRLALRQSLQHLESALDGLAAIHEGSFLHGDVRAENLLVVPDRGAVLTDPGGTPTATRADDIRDAGVLFHRMLTGEPPGDGDSVLTTSAGYSRAAVQLWRRMRAAEPAPTREILLAVRELRRTL
jgi:serine/threonine-protein kinase